MIRRSPYPISHIDSREPPPVVAEPTAAFLDDGWNTVFPVHGNALADWDLFDGDLVVVRLGTSPTPGQLAVVDDGGRAELMPWYPTTTGTPRGIVLGLYRPAL